MFEFDNEEQEKETNDLVSNLALQMMIAFGTQTSTMDNLSYASMVVAYGAIVDWMFEAMPEDQGDKFQKLITRVKDDFKSKSAELMVNAPQGEA